MLIFKFYFVFKTISNGQVNQIFVGDPNNKEHFEEGGLYTDEVLEKMLDPILESMDTDHDGFIDFFELVNSQRLKEA